MNTYIVIGAPAQGKSPFVQRFIKDRRCLIFDINNEYGTRTKYAGAVPVGLSDDTKQPRSRYTGYDIKTFISICFAKRDTVCVFEEATAFFRGRQKDETSKLLINRAHTGNVYMFLFHSINRVPPEVMEMSNYVVLFKTLDEEDTVFRKYSRLSQHFLDLQMKPDGSHVIIKMI